MRERNVDRIKRLEEQLRCARKEADRLRVELEEARDGAVEMQGLVDSLLTVTALEHGTDGVLTLPYFDHAAIRRRYELRARRNQEEGGYILEAVRRSAEGGAEHGTDGG